MPAPKILCTKCGQPAASTGALGVLRGPATGHNAERFTLCDLHYRSLLSWLADNPNVSRETEPVIIDKQRVAERFLRKGLAQ